MIEKKEILEKIKKSILNLSLGLVVIYVWSIIIIVPYYNWQFIKENSFMKWLLLGQIVPTAKAIIWPYYVFFNNNQGKIIYVDAEKYRRIKQSLFYLIDSIAIYDSVNAELEIKAHKSNNIDSLPFNTGRVNWKEMNADTVEVNWKEINIERIRGKLIFSLDEALKVDTDLLNTVYPELGDNFKNEYIYSLNLYVKSYKAYEVINNTNKKTKMEIDEKSLLEMVKAMGAWNEWYSKNITNIKSLKFKVLDKYVVK